MLYQIFCAKFEGLDFATEKSDQDFKEGPYYLRNLA